MIKAVKTSLILILLFAGVEQSRGQSPADEAGLEAVRREANKILMRKTIDEARVARTRGDIQEAIFKYEESWRLAQNLTGVETERAQIQAELTPIRVELAKKAQSRGDLAEADTQLKRALAIHPTDVVARKEKTDNDARVLASQGKKPSEAVTSRAEEFNRERIATSTKVQDARFLIEMGRLKEAEDLLQAAAKEDPESRATFYYLSIIKEQVYAQEARKREISAKDRMVEIEKSWNPPVQREMLPPFGNPHATNNQVMTSTARQGLYRKLETIRIDDFPLSSDVDLIEVLKELGAEIKKRDVGGGGSSDSICRRGSC
jgi:tetratricopeptide (TPR) repeat protein